jgi:hypothetical protein
MSKLNKTLLFLNVVIIIGLIVTFVAMAWTNPSNNPPSGGGALYYYNRSVGIATTTPSGIFHVATSSITGIIVSSSGNVGIGTMGPAEKLDVLNGNVILGATADLGGNNYGSLKFRNPSGIPISLRSAQSGLFSATGNRYAIVIDLLNDDTSALEIVRQNAGPIFGIQATGLTFFGGPVGIGTTGPNDKLDVRGNIKLGASGEFFAPGGVENLRIIRGTINGDGTIRHGSGFTSTRIAAGRYQINFSVAFSAAPTIVVSVVGAADPGDGAPWGGLANLRRENAYVRTTSQFEVVLHYQQGSFTSDTIDNAWDFIAIGPR